ncbi:MAG: monofunctional biosynthetic peptidoglycan transglycosylase [Bacteroidales bacterium]|jgi:monofunctional biosynthetic peptidoglycan transglycosylase|nr:monofunctional biosynthetic peptidoglycan transglycosylase [Bacteroidales bacterium]MDD4001875.1 monofunctional biosynthetic peptidoglycan transglycosylase [Bacteroidales bacterium]MDD4528448.1 monofunctional biosynthetic peptidoglycan transglycosylase [Bacteroidales bacterium]MDD4828884.1 monofunctional biosynthetic peptidoglycan transglycosylase [Bacteroidales bacterium]
MVTSNKKVKPKKKKSNKKNLWRKLWKVIWVTTAGYFALSIVLTLAYKFINPPFTILMIQRSFEQAFSSERDLRLKKDWVDIDEISPNMIKAVIASEDNLFNKHNGFDTKAIERAIQHNKRGKRIRGASTISQQTSKNVFLWNGRNWVRKGLETYYTILIEATWSKERIMEVYLNVIEFGDGIYGVEAASQTFFHKSAKNLTKRESALLASVLPSPLKRNAANPSRWLNQRANRVMYMMDKHGRIRLKD